jgi:putative membrane protein
MNEAFEIHPFANACLNFTSGLLLVIGFIRIKQGARDAHKSAMLSAVGVSALFLVSYLTRYALTGSHAFPGDGLVKTIYLVILFSHMILAALVPVGVVVAVRRALRGDFTGHKRVVRWLFPAWAYVSVTGVVVYVMLYHVAPTLQG